ncbi:MAG TPA: DNA polymerase I [Candidatus Limnocylindria bacterium]|jgi:DNA polymerase-1|nr:DNA polymerase I [Candidatus Limnocylindria bacterium]
MAERRPILMLIDGPSLVYRGYFALPPLTMSDGTLVNAVFGFLQIVLRGMQDLKPDFAMLSFDVGRPQFRFDAYPEYKAGRPSMPDDLRSQFPIVRELAGMMNIPIREMEGYEADDVIGSLVQQAPKAGIDAYIVSGDLDGLQLVNDHVRLLTTRMGVAATVIYDEAKVMERYGLRPDQMLDYKALKGDTSDNIPGVPGVGEKTAIQLLQQFGTLDGIYERLDEVKGKLRDRLAEHRESAFMSRQIGRIVTDLPVELNLEEGRTGRYDRRAVAQRFRELEFRTLIDRLPPSSIAPTGYGPAEQETGGGLQLSLDLLGGAKTGADGAAAPESGTPAATPDAVADPGGAIEHVQPRIVESDADRAALDEWLTQHGDAVALGWAAGTGRALERPLLGIALAAADGSAWYLPWSDDIPLPAWFNRSDRPLIGHDLKALVTMLAARGVMLEGPAVDTLVASYMVNPALRAQTLDDLAANRFSADLPERPADPVAEPQAAARRAVAEALTALLVRPYLETELTEGGLTDLFREVEMPLLPVLARMELAGVTIDRDQLAAMSVEFGATLADLERRIYELVGHEFNIGSPKQLEQILFHELKLPATKRTRTGYSTDASVLEELRDKHEAVGLILEHRQISKLKGTYVDALPGLVGEDGRLHTTYQQAVAATGRLSSVDPNLQNIPIRSALGRRIRRAFVAPPGKLLLGADYSQQELRILAHVSGDAGLKADFAAHSDIHLAAAARVLGVKAQDVTPHIRSVAKMINYGIAYGLSDFGLADRLKIPREEAQRFIADYFTAYPGIRRYTVEIRMLARDQGFVTTLLGRRRYLPELSARNGALRSAGERMAINMPIQGTAADGMKIAMVRMDAAMRERGMRSRMLLQVHDELVFETDEQELPALASLASEVMEGALPLDPPLEVALKVGTDWETMDRYVRADDGTWRRVPKSAVEVAQEEAEEAIAEPLTA